MRTEVLKEQFGIVLSVTGDTIQAGKINDVIHGRFLAMVKKSSLFLNNKTGITIHLEKFLNKGSFKKTWHNLSAKLP